MNILDAIGSTAWGIEEAALEQIREIAAREHEVTPQALEAYRAQSLAKAERASRRGDTAILYVEGPIFRKANLMVEFSGATSTEILRRDLQVALDDASVRRIVMNLDSPGGEANGISELAKAIYDARGKKEIVAYVGGKAASAAYWLAAAASEIVISDTGIVGSIGVVVGVRDSRERDAKSGVKTYEFVSSVSPNKRVDPATEQGQASIQRLVDDLAAVFVSSVASYRGVSEKDVLTKFGQGGVEIGARAVSLGMADRIGTFEQIVSEPPKAGSGRTFANRSGGIMSTANNQPAADGAGVITQADLERAVAEATAKAQARSGEILNAEDAKALPTLANHLAFSTSLSAADAKTILSLAAKDMPKLKELEAVTAPLKPEAPAKSFAQAKQEALGAVAPQPRAAEQDQVKAGWAKAIKNANAAFGVN